MKTKHYVAGCVSSPNECVKIILVGCGGNGSQMLTGLARMHHALTRLGHAGIDVDVVDKDTVSTSNVSRQLFSQADIGRNKAECLVTRVNTFFGIHWKAHPENFDRVTHDNVRHNIIITAVDTAKARIEIGKSLTKTSLAYHMDLGNKKHSAQVILGTVQKTGIKQPVNDAASVLPTILDLYPDVAMQDNKEQGPSCSLEESLSRQDLFINQWTATAGLELLWQMFRKGYIENHGAFIDLGSMSMRPLPIDPEIWTRMGWTTQIIKKVKTTPRKKAA